MHDTPETQFYLKNLIKPTQFWVRELFNFVLREIFGAKNIARAIKEKSVGKLGSCF